MIARLATIARISGGVSLVLGLLVLGISAFADDLRPSVIAPDRYQTPLRKPADTVEQQGAYAYRNELLSQQRRMELSPSNRFGASELRRSGEINREINRIDRLLQQQ